MSEYLSICPQCHQRILCDTAYVGMRVACPVCLQEITLPAPPGATQARGPAPAPGPAFTPGDSAPPVPSAPGKQTRSFSVLLVGAMVLVLAAGAGMWGMKIAVAKPAPSVATVAPAVPAGGPASTLPAPSVQSRIVAAAGGQDECRALWAFDEVSGLTARDVTGHGYDVTLVGDRATWTPSAKVGTGALKLSGSCYAETAGPVVDTTHSFTVAAWVNFNAYVKKGCQTVVAIDGNNVSAFYLQFSHAVGDRFVFDRRLRDEADLKEKAVLARSETTPARNTWYHLAGVYDAEAKTISLYVDGKLQESVPFASPWRALGKTSIGRGLFSGVTTDFMDGTIDDVRIYASALPAGRIAVLAGKPIGDIGQR